MRQLSMPMNPKRAIRGQHAHDGAIYGMSGPENGIIICTGEPGSIHSGDKPHSGDGT